MEALTPCFSVLLNYDTKQALRQLTYRRGPTCLLARVQAKTGILQDQLVELPGALDDLGANFPRQRRAPRRWPVCYIESGIRTNWSRPPRGCERHCGQQPGRH